MWRRPACGISGALRSLSVCVFLSCGVVFFLCALRDLRTLTALRIPLSAVRVRGACDRGLPSRIPHMVSVLLRLQGNLLRAALHCIRFVALPLPGVVA